MLDRNIRAQMIRSGIRPRDMAKKLRITERTWFNWLKAPERMTIGHLEVIAVILRTTPAELLRED